jgi:uncharacterized membrane protein YhdT
MVERKKHYFWKSDKYINFLLKLKKNKEGQVSLTKTGILFTVLVFYGVLFIIIGFYYGDTGRVSQISSTTAGGGTFFSFIGQIISGIVGLPWWVNSIIFTPLIIMIGWIIVSSLPTLNGGG